RRPFASVIFPLLAISLSSVSGCSLRAGCWNHTDVPAPTSSLPRRQSSHSADEVDECGDDECEDQNRDDPACSENSETEHCSPPFWVAGCWEDLMVVEGDCPAVLRPTVTGGTLGVVVRSPS